MKLIFEDCSVADKWNKPPVFRNKQTMIIRNSTIKTINKTKSNFKRCFKLLKNVRSITRKVNSSIAKLISIPTIKQKILLKANRLKLIIKGTINKPKYKLLKL
ncbi:hypothetical protein GCM10022389_20510 [Flavobacterium cheonanense]|uniref:Uncharacterized protein n=1 Tax=Flavobacterium cheonanense TaxID=706183 RepID=A0ABP7VVB6_9FLAO